VTNDAGAPERMRARYAKEAGSLLIGHLGTYPRHTIESLKNLAPRLLAQSDEATLLLLGRGSEQAREEIIGAHASLAARVHATGVLTHRELSAHLAACDLVVLPFIDGVSTRRTSAMAALAHGRALLTTRGRLTEPLWAECGAVEMVGAADAEALAERAACLLADSSARERLGASARTLYRERFDASRTIAALLSDEPHDELARAHDAARETLTAKGDGVTGAKV
jgi:glycosyltransferase involved in cell wall biosynthesis